VSRFSIKCGSLDVSQPYGHPWPVTGIAFLNLTAICEPTVYKMWEPRRLTTLWAPRPSTVIALPSFYSLYKAPLNSVYQSNWNNRNLIYFWRMQLITNVQKTRDTNGKAPDLHLEGHGFEARPRHWSVTQYVKQRYRTLQLKRRMNPMEVNSRCVLTTVRRST
jgi:hypothetical protein